MFIKINCELVIPQSADDKNFYPEPGSNICFRRFIDGFEPQKEHVNQMWGI